ncbi:MAG: hypothetical protein DIJKHBIC_04807 [Thermoanaerobaculia bacterium]|nr:hypothetical protein [Thermoanaerobaculia bacterium]
MRSVILSVLLLFAVAPSQVPAEPDLDAVTVVDRVRIDLARIQERFTFSHREGRPYGTIRAYWKSEEVSEITGNPKLLVAELRRLASIEKAEQHLKREVAVVSGGYSDRWRDGLGTCYAWQGRQGSILRCQRQDWYVFVAAGEKHAAEDLLRVIDAALAPQPKPANNDATPTTENQ